LPEDLEMQDDLQDDHQRDRALQVRQRDVPERLDTGRCRGGGLVDVLRDVLKPARNRIIAMPSDHQTVVMTIAAIANCSSVSQTIGVPPKSSVMLAISPWRGREHDLPDQRDDGDRQHLAEEEERAQHRHRLGLAVQRGGQDSAVIVTPGTASPRKGSVLPTVGQKRRSYQRPSFAGMKTGSKRKSAEAIPSASAVARLRQARSPDSPGRPARSRGHRRSADRAGKGPHSMFGPTSSARSCRADELLGVGVEGHGEQVPVVQADPDAAKNG
jgi:hypothetical protein